MNSFGLGLVLNFTDNASTGMRNATQTFNNLNGITTQMLDNTDAAMFSIQALASAGLGLTIVGDQLIEIGGSITSIFTGITQSVIETGTYVAGQQMTLNTLFKSAEEGEKAFEWVKEFAQTSIFNFQDLLPAMTTMKAVGIDVRDEITATSGATQNLLEYAGDLAAVFPNMRNSYGTGVQAAMGALKEYIAEGNAISLKRGAGLDITEILGEDTGDTLEDRTRQVADLIDQMGILGMTANLAGTPMQRLSNVSDLWFNLLTEISDSGVFEKYSQLVEQFTDYLFAIPDEEFSNIANLIGETIVALMTPIENFLSAGMVLLDWFRDLIKEHPNIAKLVLTIGAFSGVLLLGSGYILKFVGSIFLLTSAMQQMNLLSAQGTSIFNLFSNSFSALSKTILPVIALASLFYIAWSNNLFGIRDTLIRVFGEIGNIFALAFDAFNDNTLSEEAFLKAQNLGLLPFIESILLLKYYWGFFVDGFKQGFDTIMGMITTFTDRVSPITTSMYDLANSLGEFFSRLTGLDMASEWENFGEILGSVVAVMSIALPILMLITKAIALLSSPIGLVVAGLTLLYLAWDNNFLNIRGLMFNLVEWVRVAFNNVINFFTNLWNSISPIVSRIVEWTSAIWNNWLSDLLTNTWGLITRIVEVFMLIGEGIYNSIIQPIFDFISFLVSLVAPIIDDVVLGIIDVFFVLVDYIGSAINGIIFIFNSLLDFIIGVFSGDWERAWNGVATIFSSIWEGVVGVFKNFINFIIDGLNTFIQGINNIKIPDWVPGVGGKGITIEEIPRLNTGGEIKGEGVSYLHPNEVVVNSDLTKSLDSFLKDYENSAIVNTDGISKIEDKSAFSQSSNNNETAKESTTNEGDNYDYSVIFNSGSIVIQVSGTSDSDLEQVAEKLMIIIARKQQLKKMSVRK